MWKAVEPLPESRQKASSRASSLPPAPADSTAASGHRVTTQAVVHALSDAPSLAHAEVLRGALAA